MAIQGSYNFKGIDISEAYIKVNYTNWNTHSREETTETSPATYNEDGTIKKEAVFTTSWVDSSICNYSARVYKDAAERESNPNNWIDSINGSFIMAINSTAKNSVKQAYEALKELDAYKDYSDV
tara:strand:- start:2309 stop:2680 length:372 start_codon:yes stop_codon:yes gene_type:complete